MNQIQIQIFGSVQKKIGIAQSWQDLTICNTVRY